MPVYSRFVPPLSVVVLAAFAFAGCDSGPGATALDGDPPVVSDFSFDPHEVAVTAEDDDVVTFPVSVRAAVRSGSTEIDRVAYLVRAPGAGTAPIAEGQLSAADPPFYEASFDVSIPKGEIGLYTVLVYAVGTAGELSNDVRGNLRVVGAGGPPVIEEIVAPDTLQRPAPGEDPVQLPLIAVVSDPDGLSNINSVQFWNADVGTRIGMFDDGEGGDETAGDGRYTRVVQVDGTNQPGSTRLRFQATDRAGLTSEIVEHVIVVVE